MNLDSLGGGSKADMDVAGKDEEEEGKTGRGEGVLKDGRITSGECWDHVCEKCSMDGAPVGRHEA